jgi:phage terminase small subunit
MHLDRADAAREAIEREGLTFKTKRSGALHLHPLVAIEQSERRAAMRLWMRLGLHWDPMIDGTISPDGGASDD